MLILHRKNGVAVLIKRDEQLGKGPPDAQAAREEVYEGIRRRVNELDQPCTSQQGRHRS